MENMNLRKLSASILTIALIAISAISIFAVPAHATNLSYSQFSLVLGDATIPCMGLTVEPTDIAITSNSLTSNVNKKAAQVHAYSSYKQYAPASMILYSIQFSIPYQPKPDTTQTYNPQTIESEAVIWHGDVKVKYSSAIQWVLNPWQTAHVNAWRNGAWVSVLDTNIARNDLYRYTAYLDIENPTASYVTLEHQVRFLWWVYWSTMGTWQSYGTQSNPSWGNDFSYWASAENISASPKCSLGIGFINTNNWFAPSVSVG